MINFTVKQTDKTTRARIGEIRTSHGLIQTPAFVPVGTQATVKSLTPEDLETLGAQLFFVNTYHAYLRPGVDIIEKAGGLHRFMHWNRSLITDSGGFQVFSLGKKRFVNIAISESAVLNREKFFKKISRKEALKEQVFPDDYRPIGELVKIDDEGVTFTSHWDGSTHRFTPEVSIEMQHRLGADLIIAFDECPPYPTTHAYAKKAMERTHRWAEESLIAHKHYSSSSEPKANREVSLSKFSTSSNNNLRQALYGVVQGSVFQDLREESARTIGSMDFDGIAIGGVAVGESKHDMRQVCDWVVPHLPENKPRHLLGVGEIDDIFDIVERGIDTFDCVQPTRLARMGHLFHLGDPGLHRDDNLRKFTLDITKKVFEEDLRPIDTTCICYVCQNFSRAYIHHLFRVRELLAYRLATIHNLHFVLTLVAKIRQHIRQDSYFKFKLEMLG